MSFVAIAGHFGTQNSEEKKPRSVEWTVIEPEKGML
jgi:hypothetical protein